MTVDVTPERKAAYKTAKAEYAEAEAEVSDAYEQFMTVLRTLPQGSDERKSWATKASKLVS